jgi:outer membrane protein assembly factor BamB
MFPLAGLLAVLCLSPCLAQVPETKPPQAEVLVLDPTLRRKIETAKDYIADGSWLQGVRLLQAVLTAEQDSFVPVGGKPDKPPTGWVGARAEAERLLATLPRAGRELYQVTYDGDAKRLAEGGLVPVRDAARLYRFTPSGAAAVARLGAHLFDREGPDLATGCFRRLVPGGGLDALTPELLLQAALSFHGTGDTAGEEAAWDALGRRLGDEPFRLRTRTLKIAELRRETAELPVLSGTEDYWPCFRGDRRRSGVGQSVTFLLEPMRNIPTAAADAYQLLLRAARTASPGALPASVPLAIGGRIIYRSTAGIHAIDGDSGRELWRSPMPLSLEALLREPGKKVQLQHWLTLYKEAGSLLYESSTLGCLSTDGQRVYAVDDLPLPPHPDLIAARVAGATRSFGPLQSPAEHNRLRAINLATGAVVWEAGTPPVPPAPPKAPTKPMPAVRPPASPLAGAYFLGPPLPLAGELFTIIDKDQDLVLACFGAARGELRWTQPLVVSRSLLEEAPRRACALHLAFADGTLVCPTGRGAVIGIDPISRRLLWAHVYRNMSQADEGGAPAHYSLPTWPAAPRACAPLVAEGRVVLTSPEHDCVECVRLRDGSPMWKHPLVEGDSYVAGVFSGRVLIVGRSACRALRLADGQIEWQRPTPTPAGQGAADDGLYYLPLQDGGVLVLNVAEPVRSHKLERARGTRPIQGNLVFHRGILWAQGLSQLTAYPSQEHHLTHLEEQISRRPNDPRLRGERGRLLLDRGDTAGAVTDLHVAVAGDLPSAEASLCRRALFTGLTRLLHQDFAAAEKYLDEYRSLCRLLPAPQEQEQRQRLLQLDALIASGRLRQGRLGDDLDTCRKLLASALAGDLLVSPGDPSLEVRPDAWAREHLADAQRNGPAELRRALLAKRDSEWRAVEKQADSPQFRSSFERFLALFGHVTGSDGPGSLLQLRWHQAQGLVRDPLEANSLPADLLLASLIETKNGVPPAMVAEALRLRGELLTRHGRLEGAAACYRRLGRDFGSERLTDGRTGAEVATEAVQDKRLMASLEAPESPRWQGRVLHAVDRPGSPPVDPLILFCEPRQSVPPAPPGALGPPGLPSPCNGLQFLLDGRTMELVAVERSTGRERFRIALPPDRLPQYLRGSELPLGGVDHLLLVPVGPVLVAVDLLDRRVRWARNVLDGALRRAQVSQLLPDGRLSVQLQDNAPRNVGLVGPVLRDAVFVVTGAGLVCLDPASGDVRWRRAAVPSNFEAFGDEEVLYVAEYGSAEGVSAVRAYRASDGATVAIPPATAVYAQRLQVLGGKVLARSQLPGGELRMHLCDVRSGKDLWVKDFPAGSKSLDATRTPWCAVASPDNIVTLVALDSGAVAARLRVEASHRDKASGTVLADSEQVYIAWAVEEPANETLQVEAQCRPGILTVRVNGMLCAFDRRTGGLRWTSATPLQNILLDQFEELPIVLCAVRVTQRTALPGGTAVYKRVRSIDKRTGKIICNREVVADINPFHALRADPRAGTIDLVGPGLVLRHQPQE